MPGAGVADVPIWVLDTNVLVSGLLSPTGPPGRLVDALVARHLMLALDDRIELEYREVMSRPRLGIDAARRDAFLAMLQFQIHVTAPAWRLRPPPDRDDVMFLEVAAMTADRAVVSGNIKHFPAVCRGAVTVLSPRIAWERLTAGPEL